MTAVAVEWQRWQALEAEVRRAADEVLHASRAWRVAEGRYEAAGKLRRGLRSGSSKLNPWQIVPVVTVCDTSQLVSQTDCCCCCTQYIVSQR